MESVGHDIRYSLRTLAKHPAFAIAGVLVLGAGIGVNTAIFSVINGILLRPPAVRSAGELRYLYTVDPPNPRPFGGTRYREFIELKNASTAFADVLGMTTLRSRMRLGSYVDHVQGEAVSASFFSTLGVLPRMGRAFEARDESPTAEPVAIISHDLWQSRFNGDPAVLGASLDLNRSTQVGYAWKRYTVVGVMPAGFKGLATPWEPTQIWIPFFQLAADVADGYRVRQLPVPDLSDFSVLPVARLKPGVTTEQAAAEVAAFTDRFRASRPGNHDWSVALFETRRVRLPFDPRGRIVPERLAAGLLAVSGVLLIIAAANLAGMLVARGVSRRAEIALRVTLGAGRWRLARQMLTETLILSAAGGTLGVVVSRWLIDVFVSGTPTRFPRWQIASLSLDVPIDARVLAVTVATCLAAGLVAGIPPILQALRTDPARGLAGSAAGSTRAVRASLRHWIVVPQVCLSFVLLAATALVVRTLIRSELVDPGYKANQVVLLDFELPAAAPPTRDTAPRLREERRHLNARLLERARSSPGVDSATLALTFYGHGLPLPAMHAWLVPRDRFAPDVQHYWTSHAAVATAYFDVLRIPVLHGRVFDERDRADAAPVAVVSEQLARWMWPGRNPVGEHLARHEPGSAAAPQWAEVIGVVRDVDPPFSDGWRPAYYTPLEQASTPFASTLVARGRGNATDLLRDLKDAVAATDPALIGTNGRTLEDAVGEMLYPRRASAAILGVAGMIGLVLASTGLYGVMSFSVAQRLREIGVRMALGAERRDITRMILREGAIVIGTGLSLGAAAAYAGIRLTSRLLLPLPPGDLATFAAVPLILAAVVLIACYVPAIRASRVNPIEVLRAL